MYPVIVMIKVRQSIEQNTRKRSRCIVHWGWQHRINLECYTSNSLLLELFRTKPSSVKLRKPVGQGLFVGCWTYNYVTMCCVSLFRLSVAHLQSVEKSTSASGLRCPRIWWLTTTRCWSHGEICGYPLMLWSHMERIIGNGEWAGEYLLYIYIYTRQMPGLCPEPQRRRATHHHHHHRHRHCHRHRHRHHQQHHHHHHHHQQQLYWFSQLDVKFNGGRTLIFPKNLCWLSQLNVKFNGGGILIFPNMFVDLPSGM